jgi:adenine-specific DNA-methyltransferase
MQALPTSGDSENAKALGAFYTNIQVSDFLVWWAVRSARDTVMDPSFGGGVFIRSACNRLLGVGR